MCSAGLLSQLKCHRAICGTRKGGALRDGVKVKTKRHRAGSGKNKIALIRAISVPFLYQIVHANLNSMPLSGQLLVI